MSDLQTTTQPEATSKLRRMVRLRDNWFFAKQRVRMAWWPNKIRQLDRERADWKRWCGEAEKRCVELVATIEEQDGDEIENIIKEVREAVGEIPGMRVMEEVELIHVLDQMKAHHDAKPNEPDTLPAAPINFRPTGLWDDEESDPLLLLTLEEYEQVPNGALLVSINGKVAVKGRDEVDLDTRGGCIAWGFRTSQLDGDGAI